MNYLDLINHVLVRLREPKTTASSFESNPFYLTIGACVNDAKQQVEEAWDWLALRGGKLALIPEGDRTYVLPNSADKDMRIQSIYNSTNELFLKKRSYWGNIEQVFKDINDIPTAPLTEWAYSPNYYNELDNEDPLNGCLTFSFNGLASQETLLWINYYGKQPPLESSDTVLKVPSAPVYTLATAMAARERGEIGGNSVSELFALASRTLNNAIQLETSREPSEFEYYVPSNMANSNVGS